MKNESKAVILGFVLIIAFTSFSISFGEFTDYGIYITSDAGERVVLGELKQNITLMLLPTIPPLFFVVPVVTGYYWEYTEIPSLHVFLVKGFGFSGEVQWSVERSIVIDGHHIGNFTWTSDMEYPWTLMSGDVIITIEYEIYDGGFYLPEWQESHNMTGD